MKKIERMTPADINILQHKRALDMRSLDRFIDSALFIDAWGQADTAERKNAWRLIKKVKIEALRVWANRICYGEYESQTTFDLRKLAQDLRIPNYSRLNKIELIECIQRRRGEHG